jgi:catechol 2,3-dioxygenase-like lactoylglutathione lyase family enzyme
VSDNKPEVQLHGVHHTAFPTWKPKSTVEFYRDGLGLKLLHAITARGWGRKDGHPDFLHFFFDAGNGAAIAFFYYIGTEPRPDLIKIKGYLGVARHTAWAAHSEAELLAWQKRLEATGCKVTPVVTHETLESVYFVDPNGYNLEISRSLRPLTAQDHLDADMTIEAMIATFGDDNPDKRTIDDMWRAKGALVARRAFPAAAE